MPTQRLQSADRRPDDNNNNYDDDNNNNNNNTDDDDNNNIPRLPALQRQVSERTTVLEKVGLGDYRTALVEHGLLKNLRNLGDFTDEQLEAMGA
jgi:hypothetical protein